MYIAILGRQPALGVAELEQLYGHNSVSVIADGVASVSKAPQLERLGGSQKIGRVVAEVNGSWHSASQAVVREYTAAWKHTEHKITLGISVYDTAVSAREAQKTGIILKSKLKQSGVSVRLIPNQTAVLSTATSHHNKLGLSDSKVELLIIRTTKKSFIIAESMGSQNITAYTKRDQERPKRDAFVGMLPPKLAQIIVNLATPQLQSSHDTIVLDPFCGTGVVLQEAALAGFGVYGTDLSEKMIDFTKTNLDWLEKTHHISVHGRFETADAMSHIWRQPIGAVACESYLGQPFSAPPSPSKLQEVRGNCNHIISTFLKNIGSQLAPGTPLCVAVPAWRGHDGSFTHLPLVNSLESLGFIQETFANVKNDELLYYRDDQVVARELLVLTKK